MPPKRSTEEAICLVTQLKNGSTLFMLYNFTILNSSGVYTWARHFPTCNGTRQSPIDIKNPMYKKELGNISFHNYGEIPSNVNVTAKNTGHSYSVSFSGFTDANIPKISDGGLPGEFKLAGFHFHWGSNHSLGSEHLVNEMSYPSEVGINNLSFLAMFLHEICRKKICWCTLHFQLHLVHLNSKYPNVSVGLTKADGLAVLGVLLKVQNSLENILSTRVSYINHFNILVFTAARKNKQQFWLSSSWKKQR